MKTNGLRIGIIAASFLFAFLSEVTLGQGDRQQEKLTEEVYKNIQLLKGRPASSLMGTMKALTGLLGVDCTHCHVPDQYEKDDKPQKQTTRLHFQLIALVNKQLEGNKVTCYICHRAKPIPDPFPDSMKPTDEEMRRAAEDKRPAQEVYKNVQSLRGVPAGRWMVIMNMLSKSLGVDCSYCHVPNEFEKDDKPAKVTARTMLRMVGAISREIYKGPTSINCYTCHRGQVKPVFLPDAK